MPNNFIISSMVGGGALFPPDMCPRSSLKSVSCTYVEVEAELVTYFRLVVAEPDEKQQNHGFRIDTFSNTYGKELSNQLLTWRKFLFDPQLTQNSM